MKIYCPNIYSRGELYKWTTSIIRSYGIKISEKRGQNFLIDPRGILLFVNKLRQSNPAVVVEVGTGIGVLTVSLSKIVGKMLGIEVDAGLAKISRLVLDACMRRNVALVRGDGVSLVSGIRASTIVSNTPYNISIQLIIESLKNNNIKYMVLGVQEEVADRLVAKPGSDDYGKLSLITQRFFNVSKTALIPSFYFYPRPKVNGAIVELRRVRSWSKRDYIVEELLKCLFTGRRKLLSKMSKLCSRKLGITLCSDPNGSRRVYDITNEDIERMVNCIEV